MYLQVRLSLSFGLLDIDLSVITIRNLRYLCKNILAACDQFTFTYVLKNIKCTAG